MALALLRLGGRLMARTASLIADLTAGDENAPSRPRQRVSVDQLARRRRTVAGACGPDTRRKPWLRNTCSTVDGMPCSFALLRPPQMMGHEVQEQGFRCGKGEGLPVAAIDQASR